MSNPRGTNNDDQDDFERPAKRRKTQEADSISSEESDDQAFRVYRGYPYRDEIAIDVGMDHIAILSQAGESALYEMNVVPEFVCSVEGAKYLCSTGASACVIIYAYVDAFPEVTSIAHVSSICGLNDTMRCMQALLANHLEKKIDEISVCFYQFGGNSESLEDFKNLETNPPPLHCRYDSEPRISVQHEGDSIAVFATADGLIIRKMENNKVQYYKQSREFSSQPQPFNRHGDKVNHSIFSDKNTNNPNEATSSENKPDNRKRKRN